MNKHFPKTIRKNITYMTVTFTLIITLSSASITYYMFNSLLSNSLIQSTSFNLHLISETIASDLTPIITLSKWCSNNSLLSRFLESSTELKSIQNEYIDKRKNSQINLLDLQKLNQSLLDAKSNNRSIALSAWNRLQEEYRNNRSSVFVNRIIISNESGRYIQIAPYASFQAVSITETVMNLPYYKDLYEANGEAWIGLKENPFSDDRNDLMLPIIRPVYSLYGNEKIGWNFISVSTDIITGALKNYNLPKSENLYIRIGDNYYQYKNGTLTEYTPSYTTISQSQTNDQTLITKIMDSKGKKFTLITVNSSLSGWSFSQILSPSQFADQQTLYLTLIILVSVLVLSLGLGLTYYLNNQINKPLAKIYRKIRLIAQGDFSSDPEIEWKNELGEIGHGINTLAKDVVQLMNRRIEDEKIKNDLEYQMLLSQINPHFLYNTLNSIKWMATIQNASGIAEMTTSLSRLMKIVSKNPNQIHTIQDEISLLNDYFLIQKYRYGGTINLCYHVESEDLYNCQILKFTLQPLVENAIFHGIEPKGSTGEIHISINQLQKEQIRIEIKDNGIGMTEDQITQALSGEAEIPSEFFKKVGINNVNRRIKHTFGEEYGLSIESSYGEYTLMTILLPYKIINDNSSVVSN